MTTVYKYHIDANGNMFKSQEDYELVINDNIPENLIDGALDEVDGDPSGSDHLWVSVHETYAPEGYSLDESLLESDWVQYLARKESAQQQASADALRDEQDYLSDIQNRRIALASKLGLTQEEVEMLVLR